MLSADDATVSMQNLNKTELDGRMISVERVGIFNDIEEWKITRHESWKCVPNILCGLSMLLVAKSISVRSVHTSLRTTKILKYANQLTWKIPETDLWILTEPS